MNTQKRYTTQTFTKRVDHEGGNRRPARNAAEPLVCSRCGAIKENRRWTAKKAIKAGDRFILESHAERTICPACVQIDEGVVGGYLTVSGSFFSAHRDEIRHLVNDEAERAEEDNPLSQIMRLKEDDGQLMVEATTEHLAQRLGHAIHKAYDGDISYNFSHENKVARVKWSRD